MRQRQPAPLASILGLALILALGACGKQADAPAAGDPAAVSPGDEPAPTPTEPAEPAEPAEPVPPPPPAEFTPVDSPTLASIPDKPLHGKVLGVAFDEARSVRIRYGASDWSLDVEFAEKQFFSIPLSDELAAPVAGHQRVTAKACCPGYLHRAPEEGVRPVSLNAPNGVAIELTAWDVPEYEANKPRQGGPVAGRLAVVYDADNWVAGTFSFDFQYSGEPPLVRAARLELERSASRATIAEFAELAAPEGAEVAKGKRVWAASVRGDRWSFNQSEILAVEGGEVELRDARFTAPGLVRTIAPVEGVKVGAVVAALDHLGPQFARVLSVAGGKVEVTYLNPAGQPRKNTLQPDRIFTYAARPGAAGMPVTVFFDHDGNRASGEAILVEGGQALVLLTGGAGLVRVPVAGLKVALALKPLRKGQKVEAVVGCGAGATWRPRNGTIAEVLEGGIGYKVDADPCKAVIVRGNSLRAL